MRKFKTILVTGGAGFIGSHLIRYLVEGYPGTHIVNLDKLTYAGNLENLKDLESKPNYTFVRACITDTEAIREIFTELEPEAIIHLAAESHVDRSIKAPLDFVVTNTVGTTNLLNQAKALWQGAYEDKIFFQVSTDEVYGSLGASGYFNESTPYDPRSPYSASKASADHLVRAYYHTFGLPIVVSNCSNNYGPFQFPEKLIPLMINNIRNERRLPIYGDGTNIRDWLYVGDHVRAIDLIVHKGRIGETYNVGGHNEFQNIELVHTLCDLIDQKMNRPDGTSRALIEFVTDRLGHDKRYAIDPAKIHHELGWHPTIHVEEGLERTVDWYFENVAWLQKVTSGEYQSYYDSMYKVPENG